MSGLLLRCLQRGVYTNTNPPLLSSSSFFLPLPKRRKATAEAEAGRGEFAAAAPRSVVSTTRCSSSCCSFLFCSGDSAASPIPFVVVVVVVVNFLILDWNEGAVVGGDWLIDWVRFGRKVGWSVRWGGLGWLWFYSFLPAARHHLPREVFGSRSPEEESWRGQCGFGYLLVICCVWGVRICLVSWFSLR